MRKSISVPVVVAALLALCAPAAFQPAVRAEAAKAEKHEKFEFELTLLGETVDSVVSGDGLSHTLDKLAAADRDRVRKELDARHEDFAKLVKEFRDAWHDKYGNEFDAANHTGVLEANRIEHKEADGKEYAHVFFAKRGEVEAYEVHLVRDKGEWRVELPKDVNGDKLLIRSAHAVRELLRMKADWPKDESPAYEWATTALLHPFNTEAEKPAK